MSIVVQPVATQNVNQALPLVEAFLKSAEEKVGVAEYSVEHIKVYLTSGQWLLLVAKEENDGSLQGAATVNFINYPNDRVAYITSLGGKSIVNPEVFAQLVNVLKSYGATKVQCAAQESAARLYERVGFDKKYSVLEISI
jgi:hypothetical protein